MRRPVQTLLLALIGTGLLHTTLFTDTYLRYVKAGLRPLLIASGTVLLMLGLAGVVARRGGDRTPGAGHDHDHDHGHDHSSAPRVAWLLFLPAVSLLLYAPPALGAYTAARSGSKPVTVQKGFTPLSAADPVPLTLTDFIQRVQQDHSLAVKNRTMRLTGFVTPAEEGDGWYLTRIIFTCCAADSQTVKVRMYGTEAPPANTWVAVTGTWHPRGALGTTTAQAALDVREARTMAQPVNAYTDDLPLVPS
ncbi:membrane protein [Streptomyces sp. MUSC 125]|uniref:TIGR03943 family putative permease subunit n=1 Tax=unclassified Streptomyces TaxID=2593676 RepID=UPI00057FC6EE|nr:MULTISPECIES: TIGR03943 family protein [unclassified Streptomyces]KIE24346.1 membrane protein [Streptomyces sp. MUSC 125]MCH0559448.1 TIGR03943 family protein [Streptomyces sp. MUM 16J]